MFTPGGIELDEPVVLRPDRVYCFVHNLGIEVFSVHNSWLVLFRDGFKGDYDFNNNVFLREFNQGVKLHSFQVLLVFHLVDCICFLFYWAR